MDQKKSERRLIQLIVLASILAAAFELGGWLHKKGVLPFGFRYQISGLGLGQKGFLKEIQRPELEKILGEIPAPRRIAFFSEIYAPKPGRVFFHVTRPECITLQLAGDPVPIGMKKFFIPLVLKKGFNLIAIRYMLPAKDPADLHITLSENATLLPFPFFRLVLPGKALSFSKIAFHLVRALDSGRTLAFALALLLILLRLPRFFLPPHERGAGSAHSLFQLILQFLIGVFSLFNMLVFFFYMWKAHVPLSLLFGASIAISLIPLFLAGRKNTVIATIPWRKTGVFTGLSLIVLLYVFASCGSFLPLEPIGFGDFNAHLQMIKSIENQGRFMQEENRGIYPQSIHAVIVFTAKILGLPPEEWVTPFLMAMLVLLLFSIYLLGNEIFSGMPNWLWIISLGISNAVFIFRSMFVHYSFPAIIAVSMFFFALFFYLRKSLLSASLSLAAGLIIYPYYAPAFLTGVILFYFWLESPFRLRKWVALAASLVPSLALLGTYIAVYIAREFVQQKEGFETAYLLNPFLSLRFWNSALILAAIVFCFGLKNAKPALGLFAAIVCGFLANYLPYALFHAVSTYYVMKNMLLLIAVGLIFAAAALFFIMQKYKRKKWFFPVFLSLFLLVLAVSHFQSVARTSSRVARGATAANRWLERHVSSRDAIFLDVGSGDLPQFFSLTLGARRKLIFKTADVSAFPSEASWLVSDHPLTATNRQGRRLQKTAIFNDLTVFRFIKTDPD